MILLGTGSGLVGVDGATLWDEEITHAVAGRSGLWAVTPDRLLHGSPERLEPQASLEGIDATCLVSSTYGVFVGAADARMHRFENDVLARVASFDSAPGRDSWYTPWGGPPDVRSLAQAADGTLYAGVHVGGILRSRDGGASWEQTIDIEADIHQVLAVDDLLFAPGWDALHVSDDQGRSWTEMRDGFENTYMRAVAVAGEWLLVAASQSHAGKDVGIYRRRLRAQEPFRRVEPAHPSEDNIDTHWLAATDGEAAFVTAEGDVWQSIDDGATWERVATGIADPRCLLVV